MLSKRPLYSIYIAGNCNSSYVVKCYYFAFHAVRMFSTVFLNIFSIGSVVVWTVCGGVWNDIFSVDV